MHPQPIQIRTHAQARFLTSDTWQGDYIRPASLHRYAYAENNPLLYTDPSGQCATGAIACAFLGGGFSYGSQVYNNYQNGMSGTDAWRCVNVGDILIGAGAGAVGVVGFGAGLAAFGSGFF